MLLVFGHAAIADTITVFVAGAAKHAMKKIVPPFERATGHKVQMRFDTVGALRDRVIAGETPDLVVLSTAAITQMAEKARPRRPASRSGARAWACRAAWPADRGYLQPRKSSRGLPESCLVHRYADPRARGPPPARNSAKPSRR